MIVLLKNVVTELGKGEAEEATLEVAEEDTLEAAELSTLWHPWEPTPCPSKGGHRLKSLLLNQRIMTIRPYAINVDKMVIGQRFEE